ncbi:hypothetical protein BS47DRAFT_1401480 [Hydnum rufescens UP504]|uniref:Uncharacterized protein n=1 Tax=Hydnum rufescens UP504 TaxID=1448309 RepID=A0A9P6AF07_9AGAM|nr:hypothetical protein BS47DRAFT_1401480 [Hydnum rufescens UP504]
MEALALAALLEFKDINRLMHVIQELIIAHEALLIAQAWEQNDTATHNESPVSLPMAESPPPPPPSSASQKLRRDAIINAYTPSQNAGASAHAQVCAQSQPRQEAHHRSRAGTWSSLGGKLGYSTAGVYAFFILLFIIPNSSEQEALQRYTDYMRDREGLEVQQLVDDTTHLMMTHR